MTARTLPAGKRETAHPMTRPEELAREAMANCGLLGLTREDIAAAIRKGVGEALTELEGECDYPPSFKETHRDYVAAADRIAEECRAIRDRWLGEKRA